MMRRLSLGLATLLAAGVAAEARDRALIVGIDLYPKVLVNGVPNQRNLAGAVNDARRMADLASRSLGFRPEDIVLISDLEATREGILEAFRTELVAKTRPGDRVLFYYAGHGAQVADQNGDETDDRLDEVLVPTDASADLGAADPTLDGVILDDEIDALVSELAGREVTVIVDACHSGTITRSVLAARDKAPAPGYSPVRTLTPHGPLKLSPAMRSVESRLKQKADATLISARTISGGPQLAVWTAVTSAQYALEDMSVGGSAGLFTSRFVRGLGDFQADLNGNGIVTPAELIDYLRVETQLYCGKYDCLGQDPLPMLEAFDGYVARPLAQRDGEAPQMVVDAGSGAVIIRNPGEDAAIPTDAIPAQGAPVIVTLPGGPTARLGSALRFSVTAPRSGRLVVVDRRDDGSMVQLFPNDPSRSVGVSDLVEAGQTVVIPGDGAGFELVADKAGKGTITALVVDGAVDVDALLAAHGDLSTIADPDGYIAALSAGTTRAIKLVTPGADDGEAAIDRKIEAAGAARGDARYEIVQ